MQELRKTDRTPTAVDLDTEKLDDKDLAAIDSDQQSQENEDHAIPLRLKIPALACVLLFTRM